MCIPGESIDIFKCLLYKMVMRWSMRRNIYECVCICMYVCMQVCMSICVCVCVCVCVCTCSRTYLRMYMCMYVLTVSRSVSLCVFMCIFMLIAAEFNKLFIKIPCCLRVTTCPFLSWQHDNERGDKQTHRTNSPPSTIAIEISVWWVGRTYKYVFGR